MCINPFLINFDRRVIHGEGSDRFSRCYAIETCQDKVYTNCRIFMIGQGDANHDME